MDATGIRRVQSRAWETTFGVWKAVPCRVKVTYFDAVGLLQCVVVAVGVVQEDGDIKLGGVEVKILSRGSSMYDGGLVCEVGEWVRVASGRLRRGRLRTDETNGHVDATVGGVDKKPKKNGWVGAEYSVPAGRLDEHQGAMSC